MGSKNKSTGAKIAAAILDNLNNKYSYSEVKELIQECEDNAGDDFRVEFDGMEFRVIEEGSIWDIYVEEIEDLVTDCYVLDMPDWVVVDWEKTARNTYVDGYGHHFSGYDGSHGEAFEYNAFRTN